MRDVVQVNNDCICASGETWDMVSYRLYGTELFAHILMQYNLRRLDTVMFSGGEILKYPVYDDTDVTESLSRTPWDV